MIREGRRFLALVLAAGATALAGERAQLSGARRDSEDDKDKAKKPAPTAQTEAERLGLMNRLLRGRSLDLFRSGDSLGGAIDIPLPQPTRQVPVIDAKARQRLIDEMDRRKNWLADPSSSRRDDALKDIDATEPDFSRKSPGGRRLRLQDRDDVEAAEAGSRRSRDEGRNGRYGADSREDVGSPDDLGSSRTDEGFDRDPAFDSRSPGVRSFAEESFFAPRNDSPFFTPAGNAANVRDPVFGFFRAPTAPQGPGALEFMDPYGISPGKAADPFAFDPGPGFAPELSAAPREDSPFKHSSSPAFEAGGPAAPAFNAFGPTPSFQSGSSPFSAPPPVLADPAPAFVPRPAVLTFPGQKPL